MKKLVIILAFLLSVGASAFAEKKYQVCGIAFYNLENLFDTINNNGKYDEEFSPKGGRQWNSDKYWKKQHNMAYAISHFATKLTPDGPAIIGVAEIENITVLQDLVKQPEIKKWRLQIVHHDSPDRRGVDVGLLYNPRMFRVLNVTNHTVTFPSEPWSKTRDIMCVTGLLNGEKVSVLVNHWPSRLGGQEKSSWKREIAGRKCREICDSLYRDDPNQGMIIMGDLNDDPRDPGTAVEIGAKKKIKQVAKFDLNGGKLDFFNPFWEMLDDKGVGTLAYQGSWNLFDQIMCSNYFLKDESQWLYFKPMVMNFEFLKTTEGNRTGYPLRTYSAGIFLNGYSDHFPTQILLKREAK